MNRFHTLRRIAHPKTAMRSLRAPALCLALMTLALTAFSASPALAQDEGAGEAAAKADAVVNINTADTDQLALLPRVGPALAQRIVDFREANGKFKDAGDLVLVRGIGEKTFALLKPYVALSGETTLHEKVRLSRSSSDGE